MKFCDSTSAAWVASNYNIRDQRSYLKDLFIYLSIFLSFYFIYMLFLLCLALGIGFTFPGCCTSEYHGATTFLCFPPTTLTLHQPYWLGSCLLTPITLHLSLYKLHTKSYQLSSWIYWLLQMGLIGCPKTSVRNYQQTPCNISEECRSHLLCSRRPVMHVSPAKTKS